MLNRRWIRALALCLVAAMLLPAAAGAAYATLAYGSKGTEVKTLQQALISLGYLTGSADGIFGRATEKAVKLYQQKKGLTADGKAGNKTLTALYGEVSSTAASTTSTTTTTSSGSTSTSTTTTSSTLQAGDSGDAVKALQTKLKALGYYSGTIDGKYGTGTTRAVRSFQTANGLTADGKAGTKTLALLEASTGVSTSTSTTVATLKRTLRKGMSGDDVKTVQSRLKALGYYTGTVDGKYGTGTIAAVMAFQQKNGLTADGLTGSKTYATMMAGTALSSTSTTVSTSASTTKLQVGSTGTAVTTMQQALNKLGYTCTANGTYDTATQEAVCSFQQVNGLTTDGIAGTKTLTLLYSGNAKSYSAASTTTASSGSTIASDVGGITSSVKTPDGSTLRLMHWFNEVKGTLAYGNHLYIYDYNTGLNWTLWVKSRGRHCDCEPLTAEDTATMYEAFGNTNTWTPKAVYVKLPSGMWTLATLHNVPHESGSIKDNNFDGHMCVHFLRDMSECSANDPSYGVQHQNAIRKAWKALTGVTVE